MRAAMAPPTRTGAGGQSSRAAPPAPRKPLPSHAPVDVRALADEEVERGDEGGRPRRARRRDGRGRGRLVHAPHPPSVKASAAAHRGLAAVVSFARASRLVRRRARAPPRAPRTARHAPPRRPGGAVPGGDGARAGPLLHRPVGGVARRARRPTASGRSRRTSRRTRPRHGARGVEAGRRAAGYISRDQAEAACEASEQAALRTRTSGSPRAAATRRTRSPTATRARRARATTRASRRCTCTTPRRPRRTCAGPMNDPRLNQTPNTVAQTGEFARCTNGFGVFDMVGNLHEWVMSATRRPSAAATSRTRTSTARAAATTRPRTRAAYHDYSTGFRCCADAKQ